MYNLQEMTPLFSTVAVSCPPAIYVTWNCSTNLPTFGIISLLNFRYLGWLILCHIDWWGHSAQIFGQTLLWVFLWGCFEWDLHWIWWNLSKADFSPWCGWASSNQLKAGIDQKAELHWAKRGSASRLSSYAILALRAFPAACLWT